MAVQTRITDEQRLMIAKEIEDYGKMFHSEAHEDSKAGRKADDVTVAYGMALMLVAAALKQGRSGIMSFMQMLNPRVFASLHSMLDAYQMGVKDGKKDGKDTGGDK